MKKKTGLVADSHSSISAEEAERLGIYLLHMPFYVDGKTYYEGLDLDREYFLDLLENGADVHTSQPSPEEVFEIWDRALSECEEILYFPIGRALSGSYQTAVMLAQDEKYAGKVFPVDQGRVSTPMHRSILDALEMIDEGMSAARVKEAIERSRDMVGIYIAVDSIKHLKRGGRITPTAAAIGTILNIKPVLYFGTGILEVYHKCRGMAKARNVMIEAVKRDLETKYRGEYERGEVSLLAACSARKDAVAEWLGQIRNAFPGMDLMYDDLSCGTSCHIGPGGLGIGYSVRPQR